MLLEVSQLYDSVTFYPTCIYERGRAETYGSDGLIDGLIAS